MSYTRSKWHYGKYRTRPHIDSVYTPKSRHRKRHYHSTNRRRYRSHHRRQGPFLSRHRPLAVVTSDQALSDQNFPSFGGAFRDHHFEAGHKTFKVGHRRQLSADEDCELSPLLYFSAVSVVAGLAFLWTRTGRSMDDDNAIDQDDAVLEDLPMQLLPGLPEITPPAIVARPPPTMIRS